MAVTNPKFKGRLMLLKIGSTNDPATATFTLIGGVRAKSYTINNEAVDITDGDDDLWRKLLEGAGLQSLDMSLSGLVTSNAEYESLRLKAQQNVLWAFQLDGIADGDAVKAKFQIASIEENGEFQGFQAFSVSLASADTPTFTNT